MALAELAPVALINVGGDALGLLPASGEVRLYQTTLTGVAFVGGTAALVLTTFDDHDTVVAALTAGATGFVLKDAPGEDLLRATALVASGQAWLDPRIAPEVLDVYRRRAGDDREVRAALGDLTPRELDVLVLVGRGATNAEIAGELILGRRRSRATSGAC